MEIEDSSDLRGKDGLQRLVHELRVHQVELEMQNEELRLAQAQLEESRSKYVDLYDFSPVGYFVLNRGGIILEANLTGARMLGLERNRLINGMFASFVAEGFRDAFREHLRGVLRRGEGERCELVLVPQESERRQGFHAAMTSIPVKAGAESLVRCAVSDISDRIRAEEAQNQAEENLRAETAAREKAEQQLLQSQKLEVIGTLTGGIAHDFNNILTTVLMNSQMALSDLPGDSDVRVMIDRIFQSGIRGKDLVDRLLLFSRKSPKKQGVISLSILLQETFKLLRPTSPSTIEMKLLLEAESDSVYVDSSQIQQVIMNLCSNAAYAMRGTMGSICIGLQAGTFGSTDLPEADMQPGDYLVLSVKDTGSGIKEEVRRRIFEPFYTTKPVGEGTGLGLSVAYGIMKNHKGGIEVQSEPGKGSIFRVYLPKVETAAADQKEPPGLIPMGNERILFVDDEEIIALSARNMLERLGYKVVTVTDSEAALRLFSEKPSDFDLVMTDQTMPSMTGENLGKEVMRLRPDIPVILCTGYSDLISVEKAIAMGFKGFIMKPFTLREGAGLVRKVLDREGSAKKK
ncbi:MAG: ATP-binding protein [Planctomycetaceae bacterium]